MELCQCEKVGTLNAGKFTSPRAILLAQINTFVWYEKAT